MSKRCEGRTRARGCIIYRISQNQLIIHDHTRCHYQLPVYIHVYYHVSASAVRQCVDQPEYTVPEFCWLLAPAEAATMSVAIRQSVLAVLAVQNAALMLAMRYSRLPSQPQYLSSTAVVCTEVLKIISSMLILCLQEGGTSLMVACRNTFSDWRDTMSVSFPAFLYVVQNNLLYVASTHLDAASCQITYQLKLLTTAVFSTLLLNRRLAARPWAALFMLFCGVAVIQAPTATLQGPAKPKVAVVGVLAAVGAATLSGLAGVWLERIVKHGNLSVSARNIQLGVPSLFLGLAPVLTLDFDAVASRGFFQGYSWLTCLVIVLFTAGGLLNGLVHKYADNVAKGFATSLSIVGSTAVSRFVPALGGQSRSASFTGGATLVVIATLLYSTAPRTSTKSDASNSPQRNRSFTWNVNFAGDTPAAGAVCRATRLSTERGRLQSPTSTV